MWMEPLYRLAVFSLQEAVPHNNGLLAALATADWQIGHHTKTTLLIVTIQL